MEVGNFCVCLIDSTLIVTESNPHGASEIVLPPKIFDATGFADHHIVTMYLRERRSDDNPDAIRHQLLKTRGIGVMVRRGDDDKASIVLRIKVELRGAIALVGLSSIPGGIRFASIQQALAAS